MIPSGDRPALLQNDVEIEGKISKRSKNHVFTTQKERIVPIWVPGNSEKCRTHICVCDDGRMMLADRTNKTLKMFDTASSVCKEFQVPKPYAPLTVCHMRDNTFVVGLRIHSEDAQRKIIVFEIRNDKMVHTNSFPVNHGCGIIRFHKDNLYISSDIGISVYSVNGALKEVLFQDVSPTGFMGFDFSDNGRLIHVCHFSEANITTIDEEVDQLTTWSEGDLEFATSVVVHPSGAIFACGSNERIIRVIQLSPDGLRKVGTLYEQPFTDVWPLAISYNSFTDELVFVGDGDTARVLTLA